MDKTWRIKIYEKYQPTLWPLQIKPHVRGYTRIVNTEYLEKKHNLESS